MSQDLVQQKATNLRGLLTRCRGEIEAALPKHVTPERMMRVALTEARKNPALLDCTPASFLGAIVQCSILGLEPGGSLGHAYLVPFWNKKIQQKEVQFILGYRGMIDLAGRSDRVSHAIARAVYPADEFSYEYGLEERLVHRPGMVAHDDEQLTHAYAIVFLKDGGRLFMVQSRAEINTARKRSPAGDSGPWVTDFAAMACKTAVRRLFKFMPASIEIQRAVGLDEAAERGEQLNGAIFEALGTDAGDSPQTKGEQIAAALAPGKEAAPLEPESAPKTNGKKRNPPAKKAVEEATPAAPPPMPGTFDAADNPADLERAAAPRRRVDVVQSILDLAAQLGRTVADMELESKKRFQKALSQVTEEELGQLEASLSLEMRGR